jgi:hypothetical protein
MKKLSIVFVWVAILALSSCSKKTPQFVNSIPDDAIAVASLHPMQIHTKSKINTLASIKEKVKDEVWGQILEDPLSTGLMVNEYAYVFVRMEEESPVIGIVAGMKDVKKFETTLSKIKEGISDEFETNEVYTWIQPDRQGIISWNNKQMIILASPNNDGLETSYFTGTLDKMFSPVKEESITSVVDFKDFLGKMEDLNLWVSSNEVFGLIKKMGGAKIPDIPLTLYNNYAQVFVNFDNGVMNINSETHFSEEVEKNIEEFLVMKPALNQDMLNLAPGGNLLLAVAGSVDMAKMQKMIDKYAPPELDTVQNKFETAIGMGMKDFLGAITGDFTLAVNGIEGEAMIPLEIYLGIGVNSKALQKKLMESVQGMAPVEEEGDFFIINIQGNEIYSGIINNVLVITNAKGYKDAIKDGTYSKPLKSSMFGEFADGSLGMYINLDLDKYPALVQGIISQKPERKQWVERLTDPFDYIGISSGNYKSRMVVKTSTPSENSLYTIMKMIDHPE